LTILISSFDFAVRFKTRNIDATVTTSNEVEFLSQLVIYFDKVCMQVCVTVRCLAFESDCESLAKVAASPPADDMSIYNFC